MNENNLTNKCKDMSGVIKIAEALAENTVLQTVRCSTRPAFLDGPVPVQPTKSVSTH